MAAANTLQNLQEEATCPICLGHFKDPVITPCGHNFCRACIEGCLERGPAATLCCPQCRECCCRADLRPNRQLQSVLELVRQLSLQLETPPRGEGLCQQHEEKLKLFCQDDHKLICVICQVSSEHEKHRVRPINEAAKEYQGKLETWLATLTKERAAISVSKQKEEEEYEALRKNLEAEKVKTAAEFERLHQTLREQEQTILKRLEEMDRKMTMVEDANLAKLSSEISSLDALIKEIETKCKQPPEELLKNVGLTLRRCENMRFHEPEQKIKKDRKKGTMKNIPDLETYYYERTADFFLNENILNSTDLKRYKGVIPHPVAREQQENSKVYADSSVYEFHHGNLAVVTLDSETAHKSLVLSENLKRVTYSPQYNQYRPQLHRLCDPKRFTASPCVLGRECFISRRHYWEVQLLQEGLGWTVGVARESVNRNLFTQTPQEQPVNQRFSPHFSSGYVQMVPTESQQEGIWAVRKNNNRYFASTSPCTVLNPREPPKKLGVYLDYEGRRVSLYNGDTMAELHTFSGASFKGKLYPYFNLHGIIDAGLMRIEATDLRLV